MGAINTTYTFTTNDTITSTKMNNIIDQTTFTDDAVFDTTLFVAAGKLKVNAQGITSNEMATNSVKTIAIENGAVTQAKTSNCLVPVGAVVAFYRPAWSVPEGWLACDGTTINASKNNLTNSPSGWNDGRTGDFTALVAYMNGSLTIPDMRGLFIRGGGQNLNGWGSSRFWDYQDHLIQSHNHTTGGTATGNYNAQLDSGGINGRLVLTGDGPDSTGYAGGDETRPRNFALIYCIKY